jgi:tRNA G18 (ribose-2'-O)-methylase SpoU
MSAPPNLEGFSKEEILDALNDIRHPFDIAVFDSSNYFNLGSIIRTAHNFMCNRIYSVNLDEFYKPAAKAAKKYENIIYCSLESFLETSRGRSIVAMERRPGILNTIDLRTFQWPLNPIIFFGSECNGVPDEVLNIAHSIVSIPQFGICNDNNVSISAGIAMYDWINKFYVKQK